METRLIFECNVGPGRLLVSAINLDNPARDGPELQQLRRSLLDYMGSDKFLPAATLTPEQAGGLWTGRNNLSGTTEPARMFDPDLNDGSIPPPKRAVKPAAVHRREGLKYIVNLTLDYPKEGAN